MLLQMTCHCVALVAAEANYQPPPVSPATLPDAVIDATETSPITTIDRGAEIDWLSALSHLPPFVRLQLGYEYQQLNGVESQPGASHDTAVRTFTPSIRFTAGNRWSLVYQPSWTSYSNDHFHSATEHALSLLGSVNVKSWDYSLLQSYESISAPLLETGEQTSLDRYITRIGVARELHDGLLLQTGIVQQLRFSKKFTDLKEWSVPFWVHARIVEGLHGGIGVTAGYIDVSPGADMTYYRWQVQLGGRLSQKISWRIHAGLEDRHIRASGQGNLRNPVYGGSVIWQPLPTTSFTFTGKRQIARSLLRDSVVERNEITAQLTQRVLERYWLGLRYADYDLTYVSVGPASAEHAPFSGRRVYSARLGATVFRGTSIAVSYSRSDNSSPRFGSSYRTTEYGIEAHHAF